MFAASGRRVALWRPRGDPGDEGNGLQLTSFEGLARTSIERTDASGILESLGRRPGVGDREKRGIPQDGGSHRRPCARRAVIVSLQNGVGNVAVLRQTIPGVACWRDCARSM